MKQPLIKPYKFILILIIGFFPVYSLHAQNESVNLKMPLVAEVNSNIQTLLKHHIARSKSRLRVIPEKYTILAYIFPNPDIKKCLPQRITDSLYKENDFRGPQVLRSYIILVETLRKDDVELANIPRFRTICLYNYRKWKVFFLSDLAIQFNLKEECGEVSIRQDRKNMTSKRIFYTVYTLNSATVRQMIKL
jgi:hypothetical protein